MAGRNVFLSFHQADANEVEQFAATHRAYFNDIRTVGVRDVDTDIPVKGDSGNAEYVIQRIRGKYIAGTSCTIVLIGRCTWARRFVDWEVAATLRNNVNDPRGALIAVQLPSAAMNNWIHLPEKVKMNIAWDANQNQSGYGRFYAHPPDGVTLETWVEQAIHRRNTMAPTVGSAGDLRKRSAECP